MARYFVRCTGCLEISAVESEGQLFEGTAVGLDCGICGSKLSNMGRVHREALVFDRQRCACDARCTGAKGPSCNCQCGGENHGAGMLAVINYTVIAGQVPTVQPKNEATRAAALARFAEYQAAAGPFLSELQRLRERRACGEFLPAAQFDRLLTLERVLGKVRGTKTQAGRIKILASMGASR